MTLRIVAGAKRAGLLAFGALAAVSVSGCGFFALQKDQEATAARMVELDRQSHEGIARLHEELVATRERLDNALRANADTGSDLMSEKSRLNEIAGRLDETGHKLDELSSRLAAGRNEVDTRLDQLARAQATQAGQPTVPLPPPPPPVPPDKEAHYAAIEAALKVKDYATVRSLGHEYVNRYSTDDKADDALYLTGKADLGDNRPASALGEWNRLLKAYPRSNVLDKTLLGMGEAYEAMHDCTNAKLAYGAVVAHYPREKIASEARARTAAVNALPAGSCAPP